MNWMLIAYLFGLLYLVTHKERLSNSAPLRTAWVWFAFVPISQFFFSLFRAGNVQSPRGLALVEIWADGMSWLLLGISLLCLASCFVERPPATREPSRSAGPGGDVAAATPPPSGPDR